MSVPETEESSNSSTPSVAWRRVNLFGFRPLCSHCRNRRSSGAPAAGLFALGAILHAKVVCFACGALCVAACGANGVLHVVWQFAALFNIHVLCTVLLPLRGLAAPLYQAFVMLFLHWKWGKGTKSVYRDRTLFMGFGQGKHGLFMALSVRKSYASASLLTFLR